ncbi:MAG TPA: hypothetical protein DIW31_07905 [Bacteroidales bacterium]|nr:hypothetical protein [Bacteroidales bacterium]
MYPEKKFAIVKFQSETLSFEEAERINNEYKLDKDYSKIQYLLIIIDKKCVPLFNPSDLKNLADSYNNAFQTNNHKTIVWLVAAPLVTAFTHLFVLHTKDNSLYCSTITKAYELLRAPIEFANFKQLINNLKK